MSHLHLEAVVNTQHAGKGALSACETGPPQAVQMNQIHQRAETLQVVKSTIWSIPRREQGALFYSFAVLLLEMET